MKIKKLKDAKSQHNEEETIMLYSTPISRFLEIGAYDGVFLSNTYTLLKNGWSGVLIEPSPEAFVRLQANLKVFSGQVELLNCAVAKKFGLTKFFEVNESEGIKSISTINPDHLKMWGKINPKVKFREFYISTVTIKHILNTFGYDFAFINIDTESTNEIILSQIPIDLMTNLRLICVEKDKTGDRYDKYLKNFDLIKETKSNLIYAKKSNKLLI